MNYREKYLCLEQKFNLIDESIHVDEFNLDIFNFKFYSTGKFLLPGAKDYLCHKHSTHFTETLPPLKNEFLEHYPGILKHEDIDIEENNEFSYSVFKKNGREKSKEVIFLFHGLNEKTWSKYLPWAEKLVELTGKTVILFPIAFHMNRVPEGWGSPRLMNSVTGVRKKFSPSITNTSFANVAISARIEMFPQRFFWSGLQTFYDVVSLIHQIKTGHHPLIDAEASIDLVSYSIGSFLSEILMMTNPRDYFSNSRLFMFCGGSTLDRMSPNSKFILDSDATIALYAFYTERLESELRLDKRLAHYFNGTHLSGGFFRSMLSYKKNKELREQRFTELSSRVYAIALKQDEVIPPNEVINTLQGDFRDIPIKVDMLDFPYPYSHIRPFNETEVNSGSVNEMFNLVFEKAAAFLL